MREFRLAQLDVGDTGLTSTGDTVYGSLGDQTIGTYIGDFIITPLFGLLGALFLVLIIYAGFLWMTAGGESKQVDKAKSILINSTIGLIITLAAYAITNFIFDAITAL